MGCGNVKAASEPCVVALSSPHLAVAGTVSEPCMDKLSPPSQQVAVEGEPVWKASHYHTVLALANIRVLREGKAMLEGLRTGDDTLPAVNHVIEHYYDIINGTQGACPFMSAEEVLEYFKFISACFPIWYKDFFIGTGGSSQVHALCEIFTYLDEDLVPISTCDIEFSGGSLKDIVEFLRSTIWPLWIQGRLLKSDVAAKDCLVAGKKWGLENTDAYQAALSKLLDNAEGKMVCTYDDANTVCITMATRVGDVVTISFKYSGNMRGGIEHHDASASSIGWEEKGVSKTKQASFAEGDALSSVGSIVFNEIPTSSELELWFRFSGKDYYSTTFINFDHPDAKLLPTYWDRNILFPRFVKMNAGLSKLRKADNAYKHLAAEQYHEGIEDMEYVTYNMFSIRDLDKVQLAEFQELFDVSFRHVKTRDRKDGSVPERLVVTRGRCCQNVQNWVEYSQRRWHIKEELSTTALPKSIEDLKTAGVFPAKEQYLLDSDAHEAFLFHGTNDTAADAITRGDFRVNLAGSNAGTLYGKGVYLAESVSKSDEYTQENASGERCILVCRATLGCVNYTDEVRPDVEALVKSCTDGPYHCVLGDREKCRGTYREIIVYDGDQVYPEYIIWYKRVYE